MSRISITASSRVGCVRTNNEDMVLALEKLVRSDVYKTEVCTENADRFVVALADGMGGHNAGEVASEETLKNLRFFMSDLPYGLDSEGFRQAMTDWLQSINQTISSQGHADSRLSEMGTTLVGLLYYGGRYYWMNCGDSRLYLLRDGRLTQLTTDHSLNNVLGSTKHSNVITNCIGAGCKNSYLDMEEITDVLQAGDTYMMCSDGLNDMVGDDLIERLLNEHATANDLCQAAIAAGGYDNVSVCVLHVG